MHTIYAPQLRWAVNIRSKDAGFRKHAQILKNKGIIKEPIKITSESGFLKILREKKKRSH